MTSVSDLSHFILLFYTVAARRKNHKTVIILKRENMFINLRKRGHKCIGQDIVKYSRL